MNQPWSYMYSPSRSPPPTSLSTGSLWVFPVHQARALVSCTQPGLVICFTIDNIHVLMLFSQNIPPSPSPTESKSLFCTSVSLFLTISFTHGSVHMSGLVSQFAQPTTSPAMSTCLFSTSVFL